MPEPQELDRIERWMLSVVAHPQGIAGAASTEHRVEEVIEDSSTMTAAERLEIYANAYYWRLVEILAGDYPTLQRILGFEVFDRICRAFLHAHPSRHYSLSQLGRPFADWLRAHAMDGEEPLAQRDLLADVARIEWAMEEVFDAEHAEPLSAESVAALAPEAFADMRLRVVPGFRLLTLDYPANELIEALREQADDDTKTPELPDPQPSYVVVYRSGFIVYRVSIDALQYAILEGLAGGKSLGETLEVCAEIPGVDFEELAAKLGPWFQEWSGDGMFCAISA